MVARVLVDNWVFRYGVPIELYSDQGIGILNRWFFSDLCNIFNIRKIQTTPLDPQSDGIVERFRPNT